MRFFAPYRVLASAVTGVLMLSLAGAASAAEPYEGVGASEPEDCKIEPASGEVAPVRLTPRAFESYVFACTFPRVRRKGKGWETVASCADEGEAGNRRETLRFRVEGDKLFFAAGRDDERVYLRCPG